MRKTSFSISFLVLPAAQRQAIGAVYDFCRAVDDAVDCEPDTARAEMALRVWRDEVARLFENRPAETAQGKELQPFVARYALPRDQFDALIDGVAMDVVPRRFETFADLEPYCHRVASSVGLMCAAIFGCHEESQRAYARDLGVALQLTNILRDVAVDYRRGRLYLPTQDLERFGCTEEDIAREVARGGQGIGSDRVRALLEHQAARARVFFSRATRVLPAADRKRFVAAEIMCAVYFDLLTRIEAAGCDIFSGVIRVPKSAQARLALRTWWNGR